MKMYYLICFCLLSFPSISQQLTLVTAIQQPIEESSGLIKINGKLITHNDSGDEAKLYEIDSITGSISRSVFIENAMNIDWEDICNDDTFIYIGDFGNNSGARTDLKIYRVPISDYLFNANDTVSADVIDFSYADQSDFTPSTFSTNYDAEALISYNDSLYIFTKNWGNNWTNIYSISKDPGVYQIAKIDSINTQGLVTGATYHELTNKVSLSGYATINPFVMEISEFINSNFSNGTIERYSVAVPSGSSFQIESIVQIDSNQYYLTAEKYSANSGALYRLDMRSFLATNLLENEVGIYPNPATEFIEVKIEFFEKAEIYNISGNLVGSYNQRKIRISQLEKGVYFIIIHTSKNTEQISKKFIVG